MDEKRWNEVQEIFSRAIELPAELGGDRRRQSVLELCRGDEEIFAEVMPMVEEDACANPLLDGGLDHAALTFLDLGRVPSLVQREIGPYRLLRLLGEGGMGVVYLAERTDFGGKVAIKLLRDAWLSPMRRQRFRAEQHTLAELNHPSIAHIYDANTLQDGTPWFAMEYAEGLQLNEYLKARNASIRDRLELFRRICEAIEYAHSHGIIHRDLKPSNILVNEKGQVKLLDFGIAKHLNPDDPQDRTIDRTITGLRLMTLAYAAPEQLTGGPIGFYTDVYALGVLLYQLVAGRLPHRMQAGDAENATDRWSGEKPSAVVRRERPEIRLELSKSEWANLDVLTLKALEPDVARRYDGGGALLRDLTAMMENRPLDARAAPPIHNALRGLRGSSRNRWFWSGIGIALVIAVSIGLAARRSRNPAPPQSLNVAILPFQNVSAGGSLDYLRFALPDQIAHTLTAARSLTVRPLAASARFSVPGVDFRKVGHDLNVNRAVTGRFLIEGSRLHIAMEAVDTVDDRIVWQDSFDVASNNLLAMQGQIAAISRGRLAAALGVREFVADAPPRATNEEAYELYLKSLALSNDPKPTQQAIELLRRVVLLDPRYAPAWDMLAVRYYAYARWGGGGPEMMAFSDAAAEKELALNPDSTDALSELTIHRTERGDLVKAHQMAIELLRRRPDDPNLHHVLSYVLRYGGSLEEAGRECELVVLLATGIKWGSCGTTFMELGNYERAMAFLRSGTEWANALSIDVLLRAGKTDEAMRIPAPQLPHWDSYKMLLACARHDPKEEIQSLASKVEFDDDPEVDYLVASHLAFCGENEAALRMLKIAIDRNYCSYPAMDNDPFFNQLRTNPQFQRLRLAGIACHNDFTSDRDKRQSKPVRSAVEQNSAGLRTPPG
jgi:serine/threonine protein kinase